MTCGPEPVWRAVVYLLYDLILSLAALVLIPFGVIKGASHGQTLAQFGERLGFYPRQRLASLQGKQVFWVHAVSVGEVRAAIPLLRSLKQTYPEAAVVLSCMTFTGHGLAQGLDDVDLCLFFPFDLSWVTRRVFKQIPMDLVVIVETEIWPNFIRQAEKLSVPVVLVNGRISDRSFPRYRFARSLLKPVLEKYAAFCMQGDIDAHRIEALGAPKEKIRVSGNFKFDITAKVPEPTAVDAIKKEFHLGGDSAVWVAGSTHAGEEKTVLDAYQHLLSDGLDMILVLVPRHPERCRAAGELLAGENIPFVLRSKLDELDRSLKSGEVLLVDTIGEMLNLYAVAELVFVGGSLVPVGGHNVLEAALLKKPVLFGPHMENFKDIAQLLLSVKGGLEVSDAEDLYHNVQMLLDDPAQRDTMGASGHDLFARHAGATAFTMNQLKCLVGGRP